MTIEKEIAILRALLEIADPRTPAGRDEIAMICALFDRLAERLRPARLN